jgi:hypothetical protein
MLPVHFLPSQQQPDRKIGEQEKQNGAHLDKGHSEIVQQIIVMPAQFEPF